MMEKPRTRLDAKKTRKTLREIGSLHKSSLPEKTKQKLRIISWYGKRKVEDICTFFNISKSWFYRLLHTILTEGLQGLMKKPGRPRGSTIPEPAAGEIKRVREANPRIGSRRIKWLLTLPSHHSTIHRLLKGLGLVNERPYRRRIWKRFRAEQPNERWQIDASGDAAHG